MECCDGKMDLILYFNVFAQPQPLYALHAVKFKFTAGHIQNISKQIHCLLSIFPHILQLFCTYVERIRPANTKSIKLNILAKSWLSFNFEDYFFLLFYMKVKSTGYLCSYEPRSSS